MLRQDDKDSLTFTVGGPILSLLSQQAQFQLPVFIFEAQSLLCRRVHMMSVKAAHAMVEGEDLCSDLQLSYRTFCHTQF